MESLKSNKENNLKYESSAYHTVLNKNLIVRTYFRWKFNEIKRFSKLEKNQLGLDFGCGDGWLKKIFSGYNIIGYDLNPKQTDINDYRKVHPDKIFVIDVFEHISLDGIKQIIQDFKKMNPNFELITSIPTENWVSRKVRVLTGKQERAPDHITSLKEIWPVLNSEMQLIESINC
jgi:cyclopropane fatty-acyl-phospholipid synthase-like methyltransferase